MSLRYRPDIDGLRAIAVVSVIGFHLNSNFIPGGFTGVDIFFVISGFLVTGLIANMLDRNIFSLAAFYARRIKRIVPAFLFMLALTYIAGLYLLLPEDFRNLTHSLYYALFSASNVYFWKNIDTSYFAPATDDLPLLHTWSLGVEEQFYLLWPIMLLLLVRLRPKTRTYILLALSLISFGVAQFLSNAAPSFSFYMLPSRAGELFVGALAASAFIGQQNIRLPKYLFEILALIGVGLLVFSITSINKGMLFPGLTALPACLGTVLLLYSGNFERTFVSRILANRLFVFIGLLSYSLYLWHWPIFAYIRYFHTTISWPLGLTALLATALLSYLSYRFVESPLRHLDFSMKSVFLGYYAAPICLVLICSIGIAKYDVKETMIQNAERQQLNHDKFNAHTAAALSYPYNCQQGSFDINVFTDNRCVIGDAKSTTAVLYGDSIAASYVGFVGSLANALGFSFRNVTHSECPPLFSQEAKYGGRRSESCAKYRKEIENDFDKYEAVFLAAAWQSYITTDGFFEDLDATLHELKRRGKKVFLLTQPPAFRSYNRMCYLRNMDLHLVDCEKLAQVKDNGDTESNNKIIEFSKKYDNVTIVNVRDLICRDGICSPYLNSRPIYYDVGHISMGGSWLLGDIFSATNAARELSSSLLPRTTANDSENSSNLTPQF